MKMRDDSDVSWCMGGVMFENGCIVASVLEMAMTVEKLPSRLCPKQQYKSIHLVKRMSRISLYSLIVH